MKLLPEFPGLDGRGPEVWKGLDQRYPETMLELLGSNILTIMGGGLEVILIVQVEPEEFDSKGNLHDDM